MNLSISMEAVALRFHAAVEAGKSPSKLSRFAMRLRVPAPSTFLVTPLALAGAAVACAAMVYCTDTESVSPPSSARWPDPPDASGPAVLTDTTFAIDSIDFGDGEGWKGLGFDLDGKITTKTSTDVCTLEPNAGFSVQTDGFRSDGAGIDNSFGANIVPVLTNALELPAFSGGITGLIQQGFFTLQLRVTGLDLTASQSDVGLSMQSFPSYLFEPDASALNQPSPSFATSMDWPVRSDGLLDATAPFLARDSFPEAYVTGGTFVSGFGPMTFGAVLTRAGLAADLHLLRAIVVMTIDGDRVHGMLGGVVDTEAYIATLRAMAGRISPSLCEGATFDGIAAQARQANDILSDGSNAPGVPCDAISIGLGFTGRRIAKSIRTEAPPAFPACGDGG